MAWEAGKKLARRKQRNQTEMRLQERMKTSMMTLILSVITEREAGAVVDHQD